MVTIFGHLLTIFRPLNREHVTIFHRCSLCKGLNDGKEMTEISSPKYHL